jgi:NAD(P)-dependent dehydrogenase (short-subunit alcohol dehydrogenase family)
MGDRRMTRSAFITGGAGGLGVAVVERFLTAGWNVTAPRRSEVDLHDPHAVRRALEAAAPLHAVVNLAGGFAAGEPVGETPVETFEASLRLNLRTTYNVCHAAIPLLADDGAIVCTSSATAHAPFAGSAGYAASKAGVIALTQAMALEVAQYGVYVNCICPGTMDTDQMRGGFRYRAEKLGVSVESLIAEERDAIPLGRLGQPEDAAAMVAWLASEEASFSTGAVFNLTGGQCTGF